MNKKLQIGNYPISDLLLLIIAFTLPFYQQASIISIVLLVIVWVAQKKYSILIPTIKQHQLLLLLLSYFLMHLLGLLWSTDMKYGWSDIETKLSFLIMPVVLGTTSIATNLFDKIKKAFIAGNIIACIYCIITATISYLKTGDQTVFFYTALSKLMHTTYFTFYLNLALLFMIEATIKNWNKLSNINKLGMLIAHIFVITMIILLSARMAIAASLFTVLIYGIYQIIKFKKGTVILVGSIVLAVMLNFQITQLYNRYTQVEESVQHYNEEITDSNSVKKETETYNSTSSRIELWKEAIQVIKRNWLIGVGTGDIKVELMNEYANNHFQYGIDKKYNPHNQYLHTGVVIGILGITLLLGCLIIPLYFALKKQNWLFICFLLIIILNALTESIIEVQSGIIFFSLFYVLFNSENRLTNKISNSQTK